jgi:hypothetical protein
MAQAVTTKHAPIIKSNSHSGMDSSRVIINAFKIEPNG